MKRRTIEGERDIGKKGRERERDKRKEREGDGRKVSQKETWYVRGEVH